MKILYAEDDEASRYLLETLLTAQQYDIVTVTQGEAALQAIKQQPFDLIISDILMPELDGFDLCYQIKTDPVLSKIPFVFYSATYTQPDDIRFALSLGADRFLIKPTEPEQLLVEIEAVMARAQELGVAKCQLDEHAFFLGHAKRITKKLSTTHLQRDAARHRLEQTKTDLADARRLLGLLVDHSSDAVLVADAKGQLLSLNPSLRKLLKQEPTPQSLAELLPPDRCQTLLALLQTDEIAAPHDFYEVLSIGDARVFITALAVHYHGQPALLVMLRNLEGYAHARSESLIEQHVLKNLTEGVLITDSENRIIAINPAFTRITGYTEQEALGKNPRILKSGSQNLAFYRRMWSTVLTEGHWQGEVWNRRKNGDLYPEWLFISVVRDETNNILFHVGIFNDVSAHEEARRRIEHLAHHDPLTDTPNRTLLRYKLNDALEQASRGLHKVGLLFLDVDRFKTINDSLGHQVGDEVIKIVSKRLRATVRQADTVGRQGGDEFVLVLTELSGRDSVARIADKILRAIAEPSLIENREVNVTCSIGIAMYPDDGQDDATLIRNADAALYKAKAEGRNNYQFYNADMNLMSEDRLTMENALHHAINRGELRLVYQPQYRLADGALVGCEVLVRWRNVELGNVPPSVFIPIAEETGRIHIIGDWILRSACRQAGLWRQQGLPVITYAVNLSAIQFRKPSLIEDIRSILAEMDLPAEQLELELTEGILMREAHNTLETLRRLRDMGIELSIDDFGTGYSNLAYLNRFSVNKLKIDQSFVQGLPDNPNDMAIVQAIVQMAHSLGLIVIAEGVETEAQRDVLIDLGCNWAQGYWYSKPLDVDQFEKTLQGSE